MVFWAYLPRKETGASLPMRHRRDLSGAIDSKSISRKSLRAAEYFREMSRSTSTSLDRGLGGRPRWAARPAHHGQVAVTPAARLFVAPLCILRRPLVDDTAAGRYLKPAGSD